MSAPGSSEFGFRLHFDYETASAFDLRAGGAWAYSSDPSTRVLCVAWRMVSARDGSLVKRGAWTNIAEWKDRFTRWASAGNVQFVAWNAFFEYAITTNVLGVQTDPRLWACTMARAAFWGLPMKLGDAGAALGAPVQKDREGHAHMMRMCRPLYRLGKPDWSHHTPGAIERLRQYCQQDVDAEFAIHARTPPLPPEEQATWTRDLEMNVRGVELDVDLARRLRDLAVAASAKLDSEMRALTGGEVPSARNVKKLLVWLARRGVVLNDLKRATVEAALAGPRLGGPAVAHRALEIRRDAARSSTAKLTTMLQAQVNGRVCGLLQYYGAGRTGRWAGRLVQPQNMPRPTFKEVDAAIDAVKAGATPEDLELLFGQSALGVVSACLRGCLVASAGRELVSGDASQIEARMVAWLAGQQDILDVFARREDVYVYTAAKLGSTDRQFGKVLVLACGFGMGAAKFRDTAATYKVFLSPEQAEDAVARWREANPHIVDFWYACDSAARAIALGSSTRAQVRSIAFERRGNSMFAWLPSGRPLVYRGIGVEPDPKTGRDAITYMGVDQKTRKWSKLRTYGGKIVENITQAAARDVLRDALAALPATTTPVLTVHDELVCETLPGGGGKDEVLRVMSRPVAWAPGLPVAAEGWAGTRYRK